MCARVYVDAVNYNWCLSTVQRTKMDEKGKREVSGPPQFVEEDADDEEGVDAEHRGHVDANVVVKAVPGGW